MKKLTALFKRVFNASETGFQPVRSRDQKIDYYQTYRSTVHNCRQRQKQLE